MDWMWKCSHVLVRETQNLSLRVHNDEGAGVWIRSLDLLKAERHSLPSFLLLDLRNRYSTVRTNIICITSPFQQITQNIPFLIHLKLRMNIRLRQYLHHQCPHHHHQYHQTESRRHHLARRYQSRWFWLQGTKKEEFNDMTFNTAQRKDQHIASQEPPFIKNCPVGYSSQNIPTMFWKLSISFQTPSFISIILQNDICLVILKTDIRK